MHVSSARVSKKNTLQKTNMDLKALDDIAVRIASMGFDFVSDGTSSDSGKKASVLPLEDAPEAKEKEEDDEPEKAITPTLNFLTFWI